MKKLLLLIISFFIFFHISGTYGCVCMGNSTPKNAYKSADVIFIGKVISQEEIIEKTNNTDGGFVSQLIGGLEYNLITFEVSKNIKGDKKIYKLKSDFIGSSCYRGFLQGKEYFVYASRYKNTLSTGFCSRTRELIFAKQDVDFFNTISNNKVNYYIFLLKIYKEYIIGIFVFIFFIIYFYKVIKIRKQKKINSKK